SVGEKESLSNGADASFGETRLPVDASLRDASVAAQDFQSGKNSDASTESAARFGETLLRGSVILIAAGPARASGLPTRVVAEEADLDRSSTIEPESAAGEFIDPPSMQEQLDGIEAAIRETPDCKLVVIDPLAAMLEGEEKLNAATWQQLVRALAKLARKH